MAKQEGRLLITLGVLAIPIAAFVYIGCQGDIAGTTDDGGGPGGTFDSGASVLCPQGQDGDGDGYGPGCAMGEQDCDDGDVATFPGADEVCDGKDNNCDGQTDEGLDNCNANAMGSGSPFPVDPGTDQNVEEATGVTLDENGDLTLGANVDNLGYLWIANTDDLGRGTLSKVDTKNLEEVARYVTVTCNSKPNVGGCVDANGRPIDVDAEHTPSRTAVDFNMDVWVANRCLSGCQPSSTKIANNLADCVDRNGNGQIDTSKDHDGNGKIDVDCDGNNRPDTLATTCSNGNPPEFVGGDDECILFTVNYGDEGDIARSICLDSGKANIGASNAWVGTYLRPENNRGRNIYYKLNGDTGAIEHQVEMPEAHHAYGCMADGYGMIWSTDIGHYQHSEEGNLVYFQGRHPYDVAPKVLRGNTAGQVWQDRKNDRYRHYGIAVDSESNVWLGGIDSEWVLRYRPDRTSFESLGTGTWTRVDLPRGMSSRGVATDNRGKVWVAIQQGYIARFDQSIADGIHDKTGITEGRDYWPLKAEEVIGVGVDIDQHIWGVGKSNDTASRIDVDANGDVISPNTGTTKNVEVGTHPYTYSDFTGFGLRNFVRDQGRWSYIHEPCPDGAKATWTGVSWNATTPAGTAITLRVRTGDSVATMGEWSTSFDTSPAAFGPQSAAPIAPNPAALMQVEFTFANPEETSAPILHDYSIIYSCVGAVN